MIPIERQKSILNLIQKNEVMSINDLCKIFNVSYMTIWRDVHALEKEGKVATVSGGVKLPERLFLEPSHLDKGELSKDEKVSIAILAASKIPENSCIYIDAGTTGLALAKEIVDREDLTIITNDIVTMTFLIQNSNAELILIGGNVCKRNNSSVGAIAAKAFRNFIIDIAFVSASSWNLRGISTPDEDKVSVKEAITQTCNTMYLICDSSKYGKVATYLALSISAFDAIFTDDKLPVNTVKELKKLGVIVYQ